MTNTQIKKIIDTIIIKIDKREKNMPNHIAKDFDKYGINWQKCTLKSGDYTAIVPKNPKLGIMQDIDLENVLCVERKRDANELIQSLTTGKDRFNREFKRSEAKIYILMEGNYEDLVEHNFQNDVTVKQALGSLASFCDKYDTQCIFIEKRYSALWIYNVFKYHIRNILKNL